MAEMGQFIEEMAGEGVLLSADGLQRSKGARVRITGGKFTVTDGPFTETKELIAGYAIVQAKSKQEAIELAMRSMLPPRTSWSARAQIGSRGASR